MKKITFIVLLALLTTSSMTSCGKKENSSVTEEIPEHYLYTELAPGGKVIYITETTAVETEEAETEPVTIEPQELDAFENVAYYIDNFSGAYRDNRELTINLDIKDSPYADYMHYNLEILSADCEKIKVRATAQTNELIDWLNDRGCTFETNTMDFEVPVAELPSKMYSESIYTDNKDEINKSISETLAYYLKDKNAELQNIYLSLPTTDTFDISKQESYSFNRADGTTNRSNVKLIQEDADYSVYEIFKVDSEFCVVSCSPNFRAGKYEPECDFEDIGNGEEIQIYDDCELIYSDEINEIFTFKTKDEAYAEIQKIVNEEKTKAALIAVSKMK